MSVPKIGDVRVKWLRNLPSMPSTVTVIKDAAGRYFASFVVEGRACHAARDRFRGRHRPRPGALRGPENMVGVVLDLVAEVGADAAVVAEGRLVVGFGDRGGTH